MAGGIRLDGAYLRAAAVRLACLTHFTAFLVNRTTIDLQNPQNLPSPSQILRAAALRLCLLKPFRYDSSSPTDS